MIVLRYMNYCQKKASVHPVRRTAESPPDLSVARHHAALKDITHEPYRFESTS